LADPNAVEFTSDPSYEWTEPIAKIPNTQPALIVCLNCDAVLGGMTRLIN